MRIPKASVALAALLLNAAPTSDARSEINVFMRAVGFALTGSDDAQPKAVDQANCVFRINDDIYHLNNVHTDRIKIESWQQQTAWGLHRWVTVSLYGDEIVYETTTQGVYDDGSKLTQELKEKMPDAFKSHHSVSREHEIRLDTDDQDRVTRAWNYVYANGCVGKKSPF